MNTFFPHYRYIDRCHKMTQVQLNDLAFLSIEENNLAKLKFLLTSEKLTRHASIHARYKSLYQADTLLIYAVKWHRFDMIKYLLSSADLKENSNIHDENELKENALFYAVKYNHLDIAQYLLTSEQLHVKANIHSKDSAGNDLLFCAYQNHNLEMMRYLLTDDKLTERLSLYEQNIKNIFSWAVYDDRRDVLHFLFIDMNYQMTPTEKQWLTDNDKSESMNFHVVSYIQSLLKVRATYNVLQDTLHVKSDIKKHKI